MIINIPEYKITYSLTKEEFDKEKEKLLNLDYVILIKDGKEIIVCDTETNIEEEHIQTRKEYIPTPIVNHEDIIDPFQKQETGRIIIAPQENTYHEEETTEQKPEIKPEEKYKIHKLGYIERKD